MTRKLDLISLITLFLSMIYLGYGQPMRPLSPPPGNRPYGSPGVPNPPPIRPRIHDYTKLKVELDNIQNERNSLEKKLGQLLVDLAVTKNKIRTSGTSLGKWLARRDFQQQIESLNQMMNRIDEIENRQRDIRNIFREMAVKGVNEPPDKIIDPSPLSRPVEPIPIGPTYVSPHFRNTPGPPPDISGDIIPRIIENPNLTVEQKREYLENYLVKLHEYQAQLNKRTSQNNQEIQRLENQLGKLGKNR